MPQTLNHLKWISSSDSFIDGNTIIARFIDLCFECNFTVLNAISSQGISVSLNNLTSKDSLPGPKSNYQDGL
jgi:hypothetical protein